MDSRMDQQPLDMETKDVVSGGSKRERIEAAAAFVRQDYSKLQAMYAQSNGLLDCDDDVSDWIEDACVPHHQPPAPVEQPPAYLGRRVEQPPLPQTNPSMTSATSHHAPPPVRLHTPSPQPNIIELGNGTLVPGGTDDVTTTAPPQQQQQQQQQHSSNLLEGRGDLDDDVPTTSAPPRHIQQSCVRLPTNTPHCEHEVVVTSPIVVDTLERDNLYAYVKSRNECLLAYTSAYKLMVEEHEKPILEAYWCTTDETPKRKKIDVVGKSAAANRDLTVEEVKLLAPWLELPSYLKSVRPVPRYHRHVPFPDRLTHHALIHNHLAPPGITPPALVALEKIAKKLRPYGCLLENARYIKNGDMSTNVGHVWAAMPILSSMKDEITTLVECSNNKKGPLHAAIEALHESMLSTNPERAHIEVTLIDHSQLMKVKTRLSGLLPRRNQDKIGLRDCDLNCFLYISCKSGRHLNRRAGQEAAALALLRLTTEFMLEGMVAAALDKPLALPSKATIEQRRASDDLKFEERKRYLEAIDCSEMSYESAKAMWRSPGAKKTIVAARDLYNGTVQRASDHHVLVREFINNLDNPAPDQREPKEDFKRETKRERVCADAEYIFLTQKYHQLYVVGDTTTTTNPLDGLPPYVDDGFGHDQQTGQGIVVCGGSADCWIEDACVPHHQPPALLEQPSTSLGRRVEQPPLPSVPPILSVGQQLPVTQTNPSMTSATSYHAPPPPVLPHTPSPQPNIIELGNSTLLPEGTDDVPTTTPPQQPYVEVPPTTAGLTNINDNQSTPKAVLIDADVSDRPTSGDECASTSPPMLVINRECAKAHVRSSNECLLSYIDAYKLMVEEHERPILEAYWYSSDAGDAACKRDSTRRRNDAHIVTGDNCGLSMDLTVEEAKLLAPWIELPSYLKGVRPTPRYHRHLSCADREMHHALFHNQSLGSCASVATFCLEMISTKLRSYGSMMGNEKCRKREGGMWITLPILTSMKDEVTTLVECSNNKKGPLHAAIDALLESMLSIKTFLKGHIEVTIVDYNHLLKLASGNAPGMLHLHNPHHLSSAEEAPPPHSIPSFDYETDSFLLISCMSGGHVRPAAAQEAAAFAVLRLATEFMLEGMVAAALDKPLAVPSNSTSGHGSAADTLKFEQWRRYLDAMDGAEKNYELTKAMWRSVMGKRSIVATVGIYQESLQRLFELRIRTQAGSKRGRDVAQDSPLPTIHAASSASPSSNRSQSGGKNLDYEPTGPRQQEQQSPQQQQEHQPYVEVPSTSACLTNINDNQSTPKAVLINADVSDRPTSGDECASTSPPMLVINRECAKAHVRSSNECLLSYIDAYKLMVEEHEKAILEAYWCTAVTTHNHTGITGGTSPAAHCGPEEGTTASLTVEEAKLLAPWIELPSYLKGVRPTPRYHRHLSCADREMHHVLFHRHLTQSGTMPLSFQGLSAISKSLRSYGSIMEKGSHTKSGHVSPFVGHVWITLPILSRMKKEVMTLVECSNNKKGPLHAAIEALHESMLTTNTSIAARIRVDIVDHSHLLKLEANTSCVLPPRDSHRAKSSDYETDSFIRISCKSTRHLYKKVAQEAAAFAVLRLTTELILEGMVAAALDKPLAVPSNPSIGHGSAADTLKFEQWRRYLDAMDGSEKNYKAAGLMWRSRAGREKVVASQEWYSGSIQRDFEYSTAIAPPGSNRERIEMIAKFKRQTYSQMKIMTPPSAAGGLMKVEAKQSIAPAPRGVLGDAVLSVVGAVPTYGQYVTPLNPYIVSASSSSSAPPSKPQVGGQPSSNSASLQSPPINGPDQRSYLCRDAHVGWGRENACVPYHQPSTPVEQPSTSLGRRVEQPPLPPPSPTLSVGQQLPVTQTNPSMTSATSHHAPPPPVLPHTPSPQSKSSIELGNNCDFRLPDNGFVSPRHCLNTFGQIAGLNTTQRKALVVNLHARMKTAISLWPKSAELLRSVDTFQLLRTIIDALGGYGKVEFEVVTIEEEEELFLPTFSSAAPAPAPHPPVVKYRATISVILITPDNVFAYGPPQHALLMDMLRQGQGVDKSRVQEPMSQLLSGSGTEAVASKDAAMMMASVAMIDALSPVIIAMHTYFRTTGAALGCT